MAEIVRTQGTVMEVPVTIQGSKTVEGAEQRELFTEATKTTLVFENGAVLKLNAKISPGQCVFLRNDETEREILCRVLESKQANEAGYTDLEFTVYDPQFWGAEKLEPTGNTHTVLDELEAAAVKSAVKSPTAAPMMESIAPIGAEIPAHMEPHAANAQKLEMRKEIKEALGSPAGAPSMESSTPSSEEIPASFPEPAKTSETSATTFASPLPITLEAPHEAHESLSEVQKHEPTDEELDWNEAKDAELVAALAAMEGKPKAPRESAAKETKDGKENGIKAAAEDVKKQGEKSPGAASEATVTSLPAPRIGGLSKFMAGKNSIAIGIAAAVLLAAALGIAWHEKNEFSIRARNRELAAAVQSKQPATSVTTQPSQTPASAVAPSSNDVGVAPVQATQKIQQPAEAQPGVAVAKSPAATTAGAARESKGVEDSAAPAAPKVTASKNSASSDQEELGQAKHQKTIETNAGKTIPARIVSQEPPSIPAWATGLETDEVVKLDALIDEKGNLVETKPISGPRILQHEAERAVALWVFEPALTDGKPTATRMVLTVQFK